MPLPKSALLKAGALALMWWVVVAQAPSAVAASVHKCSINGSVSYQDSPCPSVVERSPPSTEQLNAERRQRLASPATGAAAPPAPQADSAARTLARAWLAPSPAPGLKPGPATATEAAGPTAYSCDGRSHCSQMRSCAEARFFLANCPGVQMDGNGDGVPCERQWCKP